MVTKNKMNTNEKQLSRMGSFVPVVFEDQEHCDFHCYSSVIGDCLSKINGKIFAAFIDSQKFMSTSMFASRRFTIAVQNVSFDFSRFEFFFVHFSIFIFHLNSLVNTPRGAFSKSKHFRVT